MSGTHVIGDLNREEIAGSFYEIELRKTNQTVEKVIKRKDNKREGKWKAVRINLMFDYCRELTSADS